MNRQIVEVYFIYNDMLKALVESSLPPHSSSFWYDYWFRTR
jgi:hypothetical protein